MIDSEQRIREQNHEEIRKASNRKILRRQMELLAEYSRLPHAQNKVPEASDTMLKIYKELVKTKRFYSVLFSVCFLAFSGVLLWQFGKGGNYAPLHNGL